MGKNDKPAASGGLTDDPAYQALMARLEAATTTSTTKSSFIGRPGGDEAAYDVLETPRPGQTAQTPLAEKKPRYHIGYAYLPQLMDWDPVKKKQLQTRLVNSGLLSGDFKYGAWDDTSAQAFSDLLAMANNSGNDWETELYNYYNQQAMEVDEKTGQLKPKRGGKGAGSIRERQPLKVTYTNPNDLSRVANEVAEKRLGRRFTPEELNKFVATYQGQEAASQTSNWNAEYQGGSVTAPPSADTAADMYAEKVDPVASTARNALPLIESVNEMLSGFNFGQEGPMRG